MKVSVVRAQVGAALAAAMRSREADAIALTADRAKAVGVALAGASDDADVELDRLTLPTRSAATVLGFHPEHVRRLIRSGRLPAERAGGDYRVRVDDLWPLLEARYRPPGRRRRPAEAGALGAFDARRDDRAMSPAADRS
jgi:excisionase family DNA binding protein